MDTSPLGSRPNILGVFYIINIKSEQEIDVNEENIKVNFLYIKTKPEHNLKLKKKIMVKELKELKPKFNYSKDIKSEPEVDFLDIKPNLTIVFFSSTKMEDTSAIKTEIKSEVEDMPIDFIKCELNDLSDNTTIKIETDIDNEIWYDDSVLDSYSDKHVKCVHEGVRYECTLCGYKSSRKSNLNAHIFPQEDLILTSILRLFMKELSMTAYCVIIRPQENLILMRILYLFMK